jgi:hypothetical protein
MSTYDEALKVLDNVAQLHDVHFTVVWREVLLEHRRRAAEGPTPWDEMRELLLAEVADVVWRKMRPSRGLIKTRDGGRTHLISIHVDAPLKEQVGLMAHELEHRRRGRLYVPDTDERFVAEEEWLTEGYARHRYGTASR